MTLEQDLRTMKVDWSKHPKKNFQDLCQLKAQLENDSRGLAEVSKIERCKFTEVL